MMITIVTNTPNGGERWSRTNRTTREQIYSLPYLPFYYLSV